MISSAHVLGGVAGLGAFVAGAEYLHARGTISKVVDPLPVLTGAAAAGLAALAVHRGAFRPGSSPLLQAAAGAAIGFAMLPITLKFAQVNGRV